MLTVTVLLIKMTLVQLLKEIKLTKVVHGLILMVIQF